jgi:hypothetical protein
MSCIFFFSQQNTKNKTAIQKKPFAADSPSHLPRHPKGIRKRENRRTLSWLK